MSDQFLWVERYAPQTIDDCILPKTIKTTFQEFVKTGKVSNLILSGGAGIGKTSSVKALCNEINADLMFMNASSERGIDDVRNKMFSFGSTTSLTGDRKVLLLDEADNLTGDAQKALRAAMEELQNNCSFVLTCNYKNKLIPALHSRCAVIDFVIPSKEKPALASQFFKRLCNILDENLVTYDQKVVAAFVNKHFPDFRRALNEIQRYSQGGTIDTGILTEVCTVSVKEVIESLKNKKFKEVRTWVVENLDQDFTSLVRSLYDELPSNLQPASIPQAILTFAEYSYKSAFVVDQEVNTLAMMVELMLLDYK
ncbi:clamp loader subunit [Synechococcus phage S-CRM01]|uniref:clamp loader of DNA polymerase n=1 Tax=Synechococcus phage S-CRM01 TaxID=1026955 RepID=UPI000209E3EC|nr:clamp loader of DNA polymerase [Synechococcus phage S-CRM01]AEC53101.1 clamp loader subunit [Synechococcus phage S-CRM01]